ncbi:hypothetical protein B0H34DRAFT_801884 [Crassisporium funariophilum]|nr:hypothetical protein B0H34DRAFT_801884 [Crassisporium funariophilum]
MSETLPPSPSTVFRAQLVLEQAKHANRKSKKAAASTSSNILSKPKKPAKKEDEKENKKGSEEEEKENPKGDGINWVKNHDDTSKLLTIIEESCRYRQAFGFKGGDQPGITSGGKSLMQMAREVGEKMFPSSTLPSERLGKAIANRVQTLKKTYRDYHEKLGSTGHGLVIEDRTLEITSGTPIGNIWEKMQVKFPWYKRMHLLLHGSPVYDPPSLAHSATPLDTGVLAPRTVTYHAASPDWDLSAFDADLSTLHSQFDDDHEHDQHPLPAHEVKPIPPLSPSQATPPSIPLSLTPSQPSGGSRKRKDILEDVRSLSAAYSQNRLDSERLRAESKRQRIQTVADNELRIQQLQLEEQERQRRHVAEEQQRQRERELQVLDKKILLAQLQAGNGGNAGFLPPPIPNHHVDDFLRLPDHSHHFNF